MKMILWICVLMASINVHLYSDPNNLRFLRVQNEQLEGRIQQLLQEYAELNQVYEQLNEQYTELNRQYTAFWNQYHVIYEQNRLLSLQVENAHKEKEKLLKEIELLHVRCECVTSEYEYLNKFKIINANLRAEIKEITAENKSLKARLRHKEEANALKDIRNLFDEEKQ